MNISLHTTLRSNLILRASKYPTQSVHYAEAASWVDMHPHSQEFAELLGDVAEHEYERGRPFLSAIVTYSPGTRSTKITGDDPIHGVGLVNRAIAMGVHKGEGFDKLNFGHEQERLAYKFWQNPNNFRAFKDDHIGVTPPPRPSNKMPDLLNHLPFFDTTDFDVYSRWANVPRDQSNSEDDNAYNHINTVTNKKVKFWANQVAEEGFIVKYHGSVTVRKGIKGQGSGQVFAPYKWARISTEEGFAAGVFYTVEINGTQNCLKYKLHYNFGSESPLSQAQQNELAKIFDPAVHQRLIFPDNLPTGWDELIEQTRGFFSIIRPHFLSWIGFVNDTTPLEDIPRKPLIQQDPPELNGGPEPEYTPSGQGRVVAFEENERSSKKTGTAGELLVFEYEKESLIKAGYPNLADKVIHYSETDGEGYDILSYFPELGERKKYVEVKTTKGGPNAPFYLTRNERYWAEYYQPNYRLVRVYNFDEQAGTANFYEMNRISEEEFRITPTEFIVTRK